MFIIEHNQRPIIRSFWFKSQGFLLAYAGAEFPIRSRIAIGVIGYIITLIYATTTRITTNYLIGRKIWTYGMITRNHR